MSLGTVRVAEAAPAAAVAGGQFTLTSTDIAPGGKIAEAQVFNGFGCKGGNVSPQLAWSNAPAGTQSFALLVHDPDAPTGSGWWHWVVYNIPAGTTSLAAGAGDAHQSAPAGRGRAGPHRLRHRRLRRPCPPPGKPHHYHFRLYALKVAKLDLPADATAAFIGFNVHAQALGKPAELMGLYGR